MGRVAHTLTAAALAAVALAGCGEPFVVLGDAPGLMRIVIGVGDSIGSRVDSLATRTRLSQPTAVAFDANSGRTYVADRGAVRQAQGVSRPVARIFAITSAGRATLLLDAGGCSPVCVEQVGAMALAADGSLYIADPTAHRVLRYVPGGPLTVVGGTGQPGTSPDGAAAASASLNRPAGVAVGEGGSVHVAEAGGHRVRTISAAGVLGTVAGTGQRGRSGDGGPALAAALDEPAGLVYQDGELYIAEYGGSSVRRVDAGGVISKVAGIGAPGFAGDGGPATAARLDRPVALAMGLGGVALYISDQGNDRVRMVDLRSGVITTFAGTGDRLYTGSRRPAGATSLSSPAGLAASGNGFLFIADPGHSVVWRTSTSFF